MWGRRLAPPTATICRARPQPASLILRRRRRLCNPSPSSSFSSRSRPPPSSRSHLSSRALNVRSVGLGLPQLSFTRHCSSEFRAMAAQDREILPDA